jgi:hypothetical protein
MVGKELAVAAILGATMALGVAAIASFRAPEIVAVVSGTMMLIVLVGSIIGMSLPFLLTRLKLDPATASAPADHVHLRHLRCADLLPDRHVVPRHRVSLSLESMDHKSALIPAGADAS